MRIRKVVVADFKSALERTLQHEGGYSHNIHDVGRETYAGISRQFHPNWGGWQIIDSSKVLAHFPACLEDNKLLAELVATFYFNFYWKAINGDRIVSQVIADEPFDSAVHMDPADASRILQRSINNLSNANNPLCVDGYIGSVTLQSLESVLRCGELSATNALLSLMLVLRAQRYIQIITSNPSQKQFALGWFARLFATPEIQHRSSASKTPASV